MNKEDLWQLFLKRNPQFETGPIAFKPETLRKFFDLVWDQASSSEPEAPKAPKAPKAPMHPDVDSLRQIFGMFR